MPARQNNPQFFFRDRLSNLVPRQFPTVRQTASHSFLSYLITTTSTAYQTTRPPVARRPARVYSTNHQATMRIPRQAATTRGHLMSIPTCVRIGIARPRRLPVRTRVVTASVRTPSVAARFLPAWKLTTSPQSKWNGCACGAACEVGGGELQADELKRR